MPDYNVGFTVLAAGQAGLQQVQVLSNMLAEIFYPALAAAAKEEANAIYAGTFQDPTGINSSVTIVTDCRPGLGVTQWIFNGTDFLSTSATILQPSETVTFGIRLYPTGLKTTTAGQITRTAWRAVYDIPTPAATGPSSGSCATWASVDLFTYGGIGFDEFVFNLESEGRAVSVEPRILQQSPLQVEH
jgi:hypothetical protein